MCVNDIDTWQALLNHNAKVYIAGRNATKVNDAIQELLQATGKQALFLQLDLSSLASVRQAAQAFKRCARCSFRSNDIDLNLPVLPVGKRG